MSRSLLFVPGDAPRKFERALGSDADALILDLEDAVPSAGKVQARASVRAMLAQAAGAASSPPRPVWVRVNALDTGLMLDDLAAVMPSRPYGIVVPKCEGGDTLRAVSHYLDAFEAMGGIPRGETRILAIATETAGSLFGLSTYAGVTDRLWGLAWGGEDLAADLGALANKHAGAYTEPYRLARSLCLYAAAAAGVRAIDAVCVVLDDDAPVTQESRDAFQDGFSGKMAIHPKHLPFIHQAYTPGDELRQWARDVIAALGNSQSSGAVRLGGMMVDRPHLRLARRLLAQGDQP